VLQLARNSADAGCGGLSPVLAEMVRSIHSASVEPQRARKEEGHLHPVDSSCRRAELNQSSKDLCKVLIFVLERVGDCIAERQLVALIVCDREIEIKESAGNRCRARLG